MMTPLRPPSLEGSPALDEDTYIAELSANCKERAAAYEANDGQAYLAAVRRREALRLRWLLSPASQRQGTHVREARSPNDA